MWIYNKPLFFFYNTSLKKMVWPYILLANSLEKRARTWATEGSERIQHQQGLSHYCLLLDRMKDRNNFSWWNQTTQVFLYSCLEGVIGLRVVLWNTHMQASSMNYLSPVLCRTWQTHTESWNTGFCVQPCANLLEHFSSTAGSELGQSKQVAMCIL